MPLIEQLNSSKGQCKKKCISPPLFPRIPLNEEPMQHQGQHGHETKIKPVIEFWGLGTAFTNLLEVGSLPTRTHLVKNITEKTN